MALSQKHAGKMLVPWFNSKEWKHVNNLIFATNSTDKEKSEALAILQLWKIRTPKLPSGVEGTLIILDVLLQKEDAVSEDKLRILYGASIMRFLNLCGAVGDKQGTFYKSAKQNKLPDWLVDVRHNIAHDQIIPSMFMLRMSLEFCLSWLKLQYWDQQNATIKDFIVDDNTNNIKTLVELYCHLNFSHYLGNVRNIQDISAYDSEIIDKLNVLAREDINENLDIKDLLKILLEKISDQICCNIEDVIVEAIISDGSIFETELNEKEKLPKKFVMLWQDLIKFLYSKNMFLPLFKKIINISSNIEATEITKKIASLWLAELCKSLLLAMDINEQYKNLSKNDKLTKQATAAILKQVIQSRNPDLKDCIELDFEHCENIIADLNSLRLNIMENPHKFTLIFVKYFLQVTGCSDEYINNTEALIKSYLYPQSNCLVFSELHTLEEFQQTTMKITDTTTPMDALDNEENVTIANIDVALTEETEYVGPRRWRIVKDTSIFDGCPLGVLAHQDRTTNPLLDLQPL